MERALDRAYKGAGLIGSYKDIACVLAGINCGNVLFSVLQTGADPGPDPVPWDEAEEADLATPTGDFRYGALMGDTGEDPREPYETNLAHAGPGTYRMRLHARGRDINPNGVQDEDEDEPIAEHHLYEVWPKHTTWTSHRDRPPSPALEKVRIVRLAAERAPGRSGFW